MRDIDAGEIEQVIISEVSRLSRSVRDFAATVERIVDENGVGLHILDMEIALDPNDSDPYTRAFLTVAATFAELEAQIKRENTREGIAAARAQGKWHGRPPFGFDVGAEGYLSPNENYDTALVILDELDKGASKRGLARSTGVARGTIPRLRLHWAASSNAARGSASRFTAASEKASVISPSPVMSARGAAWHKTPPTTMPVSAPRVVVLWPGS